MLTPDQHYANALHDIACAIPAMRPPRRVSVSEGAAHNLYIKQAGGYIGPWSADEAPYMPEPMDMLASRLHEAVVFVGPARTGKTMGLLEGWASHVIPNDPGDMLIVQMTQDKAREYSRTRIDRMLDNEKSPLIAYKSSSAQDDNTHDKMFRHGMWLRIAWPTVSNLSSSDYRYVALTDYDRMPQNVDGEGSPFALGRKRTTTFLSRGMCLAESSPGFDIRDPNQKPATAHEAPAVEGILSLYNQGDRRRWYWKCFDCRERFEAAPGLGLFGLPPRRHLLDIVREADLDGLAKQYGRVICPHCGSLIEKRWKHDLNKSGRWVRDGQQLTRDDELVGTPINSNIASYWLGGVAAAYQSWHSLLLRYFQGLQEYALAGTEVTLRTTVNTDQGMPYTPAVLLDAADNNANPADRGEVLERYVVPAESRFLTAQVDVQGGVGARFEVQIHAHGPHAEQWLVNRFAIKDSRRPGLGDEFAPIDPASYVEDWDRLTDEVLLKTYRTPIEGKELRVLMMAVDSGGEAGKDAEGNKAGVTNNAYAYYRRVRLRGDGLYERVMLTKGRAGPQVPRIRKTMVGAVKPGDQGDVPLYTFNSDLMKDEVDAALRRTAPGPGYMHFPSPKGPRNPDGWLPLSFFDELKAEVRGKDGKWSKIRKRNESLDLCVLARVASLRLKADQIRDWSKAPKWAAPLEQNSELVTSQDRRDMQENAVRQSAVSAPAPAPAGPARRPRRVIASPYLS